MGLSDPPQEQQKKPTLGKYTEAEHGGEKNDTLIKPREEESAVTRGQDANRALSA